MSLFLLAGQDVHEAEERKNKRVPVVPGMLLSARNLWDWCLPRILDNGRYRWGQFRRQAETWSANGQRFEPDGNHKHGQ